jgi:hypothetical protein
MRGATPPFPQYVCMALSTRDDFTFFTFRELTNLVLHHSQSQLRINENLLKEKFLFILEMFLQCSVCDNIKKFTNNFDIQTLENNI